MKMNMKTINKLCCMYFSLFLFWSMTALSKEFFLEDIDRLLSDNILYSRMSFYRNAEYDALHEWLTQYHFKEAPEGFDEKAMKIITSFDVRRAVLENRKETRVVEERGSIFAVMLYANQSLRYDTKYHLEIAKYLGGIERINVDEYESDQKNVFRKKEEALYMNQSIMGYRNSLIGVIADRLRDLKRNLDEEQFNTFTNDFVKIGKLNEIEAINLRECIISQDEYLRLRKEFENKKCGATRKEKCP